MIGEEGKNELAALWDNTHRHGEKISNLEKIAARLETGQDSLEDKIDTGFSALQADLQRSVKPPLNVIGVATLSLILLGSFGTVLTYMTGQTSASMKRENDLRFKAVLNKEDDSSKATSKSIEVISNDIRTIVLRMAEDDKREQQDMYDKGVADARHKALRYDFNHLDAELHIRHRRSNDLMLDFKDKLSYLEERSKSKGE